MAATRPAIIRSRGTPWRREETDVLNREPQIGRRHARAFTLVELLIVIGIIGLLIGILLPAVNKVRVAAQKVATQGTLNRLSAAIETYHTAFGSYPGPVVNGNLTNPIPPALPTAALPTAGDSQAINFVNYPASGIAPTSPDTKLTSTENMMIAILGGLRRTTGAMPIYNYDFTTIGQGAVSLNANRPAKNQPYLEVRTNELTTTYANPEYPTGAPGQWTAFDSAVPEILDGFANPKPILYLRASRANTGFVASKAVPAPTDAPQYDVRHLYPYGFPVSDDTAYLAANPTDSASGLALGDDSYFGNHELSRPGAANRVIQHKDGFLLISAGADRKFGTADDIRN